MPDDRPKRRHRLPARWDRRGLQAVGFTGFVRFNALSTAAVPAEPGVYVVVRVAEGEPDFRDRNPAGRFKGRDPTAPIDQLRAAWVRGASVLYVGKADVGAHRTRGLSVRLNEFRRFAGGTAVGHWGGRYVFQLADADEHVVAWCPTGDVDPQVVKADLIAAFREVYGQRPFANRNAGRRRAGNP